MATIKHRFQSTVADSGSATKVTSNRWNDSLVVDGGTDTGFLFRDSSAADGWSVSSTILWNDATFTATVASGIIFASGTITTSKPFKVTQTWNDGSATFRGVDLAFTETGSGASSTYLRVLGGAAGTTVEMSVTKGGALFALGAITTQAGSIILGSGTQPNLLSSGTDFYVTVGTGAIAAAFLNGVGVITRSDYYIGFSPGSNPFTAPDSYFSRTAAGVITVTSDIVLRHIEINGDLNHDGSNIGFFGIAPAARASAYTVSNVTTDRTYDANGTTTDELADVLGTLIADLTTYGLLQ